MILRKNKVGDTMLLDCGLYYRAMVVKAVWCWYGMDVWTDGAEWTAQR